MSSSNQPKARAVALQVMLAPGSDPATIAGATAIASQVFVQRPKDIQAYAVQMEIIGRGLIPVSITSVKMEIIGAPPYSVQNSGVVLEIIADTTLVPKKPMQRIIWFHGS